MVIIHHFYYFIRLSEMVNTRSSKLFIIEHSGLKIDLLRTNLTLAKQSSSEAKEI